MKIKKIDLFIENNEDKYIGSTMSAKNNAVSKEALKDYSKEYNAHCRCLINNKWVYAFNGEILELEGN